MIDGKEGCKFVDLRVISASLMEKREEIEIERRSERRESMISCEE